MTDNQFFMRLIFIFICCQYCLAQDSIIDAFSDGNFTQNPIWKGDTSAFTITQAQQLQLAAQVGTSPQMLYTTSELIEHGYWSFYCKMLFNPSSQNYAEIVLLNPDTAFNTNYTLSILLGKNQDKLSIKSSNYGNTHILSESNTPVFTSSENELWCKVYYETPHWTVSYSKDSTVWTNLPHFTYEQQDTKTFGLKCYFTSTRRDKFYFDDFKISGYPYRDTIPPQLNKFLVTEELSIRLHFSEPIDTNSALINQNIVLENSSSTLSNSIIIDPKTIEVFFNSIDYNTVYNLKLEGIKDLNNNILSDTSITFSAQYIYPYSIIINEVMVDPSPPVYLPEVEYVEIKNTTHHTFNLNNCKLKVGNSYLTLPNYNLQQGSIAVIYPAYAKPLVDSLPNTLFLNTSFSLPNTSGNIAFLDSNLNTIHIIKYDDSWYKNTNKEQGGWSLEHSPNAPYCLQKLSWQASNNMNGGSPGEANINIPYTQETEFITPNSYVDTDTSINLYFPFSILNKDFTNPEYYSSPLTIDTILRTSAFSLNILFNQHISPNTLYTLDISEELQTCMPYTLSSIYFGQTNKPNIGQIKLSEILFNVDNTHTEFIEFKNTSSLNLDAFDLVLGIIKDTVLHSIAVSNEHKLIPGNRFMVFTKSNDLLKQNYPLNPEAIYITLKDWISLDNKEGQIVLLDRSLQTLDSGCYHYTWHSTFLEETENVSLEKPNLNSSSCLADFWASASETDHFATPGFTNSQNLLTPLTEEPMKSFSPNNDGFEDLWIYTHIFSSPENYIDISIYNLNGFKLHTIANGLLVGKQHSILWDGKIDNGLLLPTGTYILIIYNRNDSKTWKYLISITD